MARSLRRQDGFVREAARIALVVAVAALVVLDAIALVGAARAVEDSASRAARDARYAHYETQSRALAKTAAKASLARSGKDFLGIEVKRGEDGVRVFSVTARGHAETFGFKYLRYAGLGDWVDRTTNPTSTQSAR